MANEPTGENPVQKSADESSAQRSRHRSGRGRRSQNSADRKPSPEQGNPTDQKSAPQQDKPSDRKPSPKPGDSSGRKSSPRQQTTPPDRRSTTLLGNADDRKPSSRQQQPQQQGGSADRKPSLRWTWRDYLLQLSVVIAGIVVTFVGSAQIERWRQARQVRATMQLVVSELESNRTKVNYACERLIRDRHGMLMFMQYHFNVDAIPLDSLKRYDNPHLIGNTVGIKLQNDALEVLKSSGVSASVGDKQLLMEVLACYNRLQAFTETLDAYNDRKMSALDHLFEHGNPHDLDYFSIGGNDPRGSWKTMLSDRMCQRFLGFSPYFFGNDQNLQERVADLDATISLIKEKYRLE